MRRCRRRRLGRGPPRDRRGDLGASAPPRRSGQRAESRAHATRGLRGLRALASRARCRTFGRGLRRGAREADRSKSRAAKHAMFLSTSDRAVARGAKVAQPSQRSTLPTNAIRCGERGDRQHGVGRVARRCRSTPFVLHTSRYSVSDSPACWRMAPTQTASGSGLKLRLCRSARPGSGGWGTPYSAIQPPKQSGSIFLSSSRRVVRTCRSESKEPTRRASSSQWGTSTDRITRLMSGI